MKNIKTIQEYFSLKNHLPLRDDPEGFMQLHLGIGFQVQ